LRARDSAVVHGEDRLGRADLLGEFLNECCFLVFVHWFSPTKTPAYRRAFGSDLRRGSRRRPLGRIEAPPVPGLRALAAGGLGLRLLVLTFQSTPGLPPRRCRACATGQPSP